MVLDLGKKGLRQKYKTTKNNALQWFATYVEKNDKQPINQHLFTATYLMITREMHQEYKLEWSSKCQF